MWWSPDKLLPAEGEWVIAMWSPLDLSLVRRRGEQWWDEHAREVDEPKIWTHVPKFR